MTEIRTTWTSTLESMEQLGFNNPRIQTRITETIDGEQDTSYMLLYDSLGHEMGVHYDDRNQIRIDAVTRYNIAPGSAEYYMRRLFPFDWHLNRAEGQRIFIYRYDSSVHENYMEGFQASLAGFNEEGIVLRRWEGEPFVIKFEDALGAVLVDGQDNNKLGWILDFPVNKYPLVTNPLGS